MNVIVIQQTCLLTYDLIYPSLRSKFRAVVQDIKQRHEAGQPILVGMAAVETSELLSNMLRAEGIPHEVLNAKTTLKQLRNYHVSWSTWRCNNRDKHGRRY